MAKKRGRKSVSQNGASKAEHIRRAFGKLGWDARAKDVIAAVAGEGVEVSSAQVSNIRTAHLETGGKPAKARRGKPAARAAASSDVVSRSALLSAKKLVDQVGADEAQAAIDLLKTLNAS